MQNALVQAPRRLVHKQQHQAVLNRLLAESPPGRVARQPVREEDAGIVGGHIAIHRHHIKRIGDGGAYLCLHPCRFDGGIGCQVAEHGSHIRVDHARAFGDSTQAHGASLKLKFERGTFGARVGGHNGFREGIALVLAQFDVLHARLNLLYGQLAANDARGRTQHHLVFQPQSPGGILGHTIGIEQAEFARGAIGVTAIDDHRLSHATLQTFLANHDRRGARAAGSKCTGSYAGNIRC